MNSFLNFIANLIKQIAIIGGGLPSAGFSFSPHKPSELANYIKKSYSETEKKHQNG